MGIQAFKAITRDCSLCPSIALGQRQKIIGTAIQFLHGMSLVMQLQYAGVPRLRGMGSSEVLGKSLTDFTRAGIQNDPTLLHIPSISGRVVISSFSTPFHEHGREITW